MSQSHKDVLKRLCPATLTGVFDGDITLEGAFLDAAAVNCEDLMDEMFPDGASELIDAWERVCGTQAADGDTLQTRQNKVIQVLRSIGRLDAAFYVMLAALRGYSITITEYPQNYPGYGEESIFIWTITAGEQESIQFECGVSCAGERLLDWESQTALEGLFQDLKPAHTMLIIGYE